jgi:hypothetical protein
MPPLESRAGKPIRNQKVTNRVKNIAGGMERKDIPGPENVPLQAAPTSTPQPELQRRQMLLVRLRGEYILSQDGLSAALLAGTEQPPAHWTNGRLKELGEKWTVHANEGAGMKGHESVGALVFGQRIFTPIGQVPGYEARAVEIHNSQRDYEQTYHGVRAELIFTHCDHKETIRKTAWLTGMKFGKMVGLQTQSADLDAKKNNRIFVIVYVRTHVPPACYSYLGPPPYDAPDYSPLMEGLLLSHESQQFRFGKWEVKLVVTCDSGEIMETTELFNAD